MQVSPSTVKNWYHAQVKLRIVVIMNVATVIIRSQNKIRRGIHHQITNNSAIDLILYSNAFLQVQ